MITSELTTEGGRTLVVKRADPAVALDAERLTREATMLAMARHPGVVELADTIDGPTGLVELRTIFAGARTLAAPDLAPSTAARALAAAAGTVADLHGLGLVHGRVAADHVVLTGSGRAVLCGLAESGLAGDVTSDGGVLLPSLDVASLGSLLRSVLADADAEGRRSSIDRTAVARLVDRATAADPVLRPSARAFAASLAASLPRPTEPRTRSSTPTAAVPPPPAAGTDTDTDTDTAEPAIDPTGAAPPRSDRRHRRVPGRRLLAGAGALVAVVALGVGVDALADAPPRRTAPSPPTTAPAAGELRRPAPEHQPASNAAQPGGELDLHGHHLRLGSPDDQILHAVWGCSGPEAVVLVQPDGSVFRFDGLAIPGHDVTGILVARVPCQATVELTTGADGCIVLQARALDRTVSLAIPSTGSSPTPA